MEVEVKLIEWAMIYGNAATKAFSSRNINFNKPFINQDSARQEAANAVMERKWRKLAN